MVSDVNLHPYNKVKRFIVKFRNACLDAADGRDAQYMAFDIYQIMGGLVPAKGLLGGCSWVVWCLLRASSRPTPKYY